MDKNTMLFLIILLLVLVVVGYLFWRSYEESRVANEYDRGAAWAGSAASMASSAATALSAIFGKPNTGKPNTGK